MSSPSRSVFGSLGVLTIVVGCIPAGPPSSSVEPSHSAPAPTLNAPSPSSTAETAKPTPPPRELAPDHVRSQADCAEDMLFVPGGHHVYQGRPYDGSKERSVTKEFAVDPFCIDEFEVPSYGLLRCKDCEIESACSSSAGVSFACYTQRQASAYCSRRTGAPSGRLPRAGEFLFAARGTDGRKFPWGNSWYPWGNDSEQGRPSSNQGFFCDFEFNEGQVTKERKLLFSPGCASSGNSLDVSPFGVKNLASNLLEWTSETFVDNGETFGVILGVDYSWARSSGFSPNEDLAPRLHVSSDERRPIEVRASKLVGFRCVTTTKITAP